GGTGDGILLGSSSSGSGSNTSAPPPTISGVIPTSGPTTGGTTITVTGTNFPTASGLTVTFGGTAATSVVVNSSTSATVTSPVHNAAGAVDVVVSSSGQSATLTNGFTYFAAGTPLQISTTSPLPDVVRGTAVNRPIV